jgi:hypothetical protein
MESKADKAFLAVVENLLYDIKKIVEPEETYSCDDTAVHNQHLLADQRPKKRDWLSLT